MSRLERALTSASYHEILDVVLGGWGRPDGSEELIAQHLAFVGDIDLSTRNYSFHLLRFYVRKSDGVVLYGTDCGCSCPSPFQDFSVSDLKETRLSRVMDVALLAAAKGDRPWAEVSRDVDWAIQRMKQEGAI